VICAPAEERELEHRRLPAPLEQEEGREQQGAAGQHSQDQPARPALLVAAEQREHEHEQRAAQRDEAQPVDPSVLLVAGLAELDCRDEGRRGSDRDVHEEDPAPGKPRGQSAADERADGNGDTGRRSPDAEGGPAFASVELLRQEGEGGREHDRPADSLSRAREDEEERRGRGAAERGGGREEEDAADEDALPSEQIGERSCVEHEGREGQRVRVDHPLEVGEAGVQRSRDGRQRDVHDRDVEEQHEDRRADHDQGPPFAFQHVSTLTHADRVSRRPVRCTGDHPETLEDSGILARKSAPWGSHAYFRVRTHARVPVKGER